MIRIVNLTKEYRSDSGRILALDGVSLNVQKGQRIGVLGANGSGKSTLIRLVGGVELPTSGRVRREMTVSWPLGFRGGFEGNLSALDNLRFIARIYQKNFEELAAFVEDFSELGRRLQDPVNTYSSGMRAKLSFGVSLGVEFDCYLIDEVVAVGDKRFRRKCREELEEKRHDRAMLMVSHQPNNIKQFCDTAILLEQGRYVDSFDVKSGTEWRKHAQPRPDG